MIRLFNVYYPVRALILLIGEALIVSTSLLLVVVPIAFTGFVTVRRRRRPQTRRN